ncbi:heavy-metal-associated domain-containing protein [Tamlana sp. I1]|uniref:heavy-metal-associated domain-containing protein n=1 Tax=Tamlana sp. I1 TaxID=2762061 RepID=UPI00188E0107|nr:cation transporter [Tamlana sp. I1]
MKKVLLGLLLFVGFATYAQNKNAKASLEVDGVCLMCKSRIEKACLKTKGVKSAVWNVKTHELKLIYDARKTDVATIESSILAVGHDTEALKATDEAYASVHPCCRYRDEAVQDDHKVEEEEHQH